MKKLIITAWIFLLFSGLAFSQKLNIQLDIQNKKIEYYRLLEKELGSESFHSEYSYISNEPVSQPEIFLRKESNLPNLLIYYTFFKKDSTISQICYEWDVYNFDQKENNPKSLSFEKSLIKKYRKIVAFVSSRYGKSKVEGSIDDISKINSAKGLTRIDAWTPNDSLKVYAYTTVSNYYKKDDLQTIMPTHRIRVYLYNLK